MSDKKMYTHCMKINDLAPDYQIGQLQEIRKAFKGKKRRPTKNLFTKASIKDDYAFHLGGRTEIQFNVGFEGKNELRHGIAFSLETSQALPRIDVLVPKINRFNLFMKSHGNKYSDMRMWYYDEGRSDEYKKLHISEDLIHPGIFIFIGKKQPYNSIDYSVIMKDFDRLLDLYIFVESETEILEPKLLKSKGYVFKPGCTQKSPRAEVIRTGSRTKVNLRHNVIQQKLHERLVKQFGAKNVGTENDTRTGYIDLVLNRPGKDWYYEIKTAASVRMCLRAAIGQLFEYSYWSGSEIPERLIVVGEAKPDKEEEKYLRKLRKQFSIPIYYEQFKP